MATITEPPADTAAAVGRRPFRIPGEGILLANVALVLVGLLILDVQLFSRASMSTLTPTIGVMILVALGQAFIIGTGGIDLSIPVDRDVVRDHRAEVVERGQRRPDPGRAARARGLPGHRVRERVPGRGDPAGRAGGHARHRPAHRRCHPDLPRSRAGGLHRALRPVVLRPELGRPDQHHPADLASRWRRSSHCGCGSTPPAVGSPRAASREPRRRTAASRPPVSGSRPG